MNRVRPAEPCTEELMATIGSFPATRKGGEEGKGGGTAGREGVPWAGPSRAGWRQFVSWASDYELQVEGSISAGGKSVQHQVCSGGTS